MKASMGHVSSPTCGYEQRVTVLWPYLLQCRNFQSSYPGKPELSSVGLAAQFPRFLRYNSVGERLLSDIFVPLLWYQSVSLAGSGNEPSPELACC